MRRHLTAALSTSLLALLLLAGPALATNGYLLHGIGTSSKGLGGAGIALHRDAFAAAVNPAALAFVGKRYDAGLALFSPQRQYTVTGAPSGFPGTFGLTPGTVESDAELFPVPSFGASWARDSGDAWGLAIYGQGGMNTEYPTATFYGSSVTGVDLSQMFIAPSYARRLNERHAIGVSPILAIQTFEAQGLEAFAAFSGQPGSLTNNGHEESVGFGARVGYYGRWTDRLSFGASYQSEIAMDEFADYAGLFAGGGDFDIPANWVAGFAFDATPNVTLVLDVQEIYYSDIASVGSPLLPNLVQAPLGSGGGAGFGWQDMTVYKAGVQWSAGNDWTWRLGFSTTEQPIPESEVLFNILAPGVMEEHLTIGFTKVFPNARALNFSLMHAPSTSVSGPNPLEVPGLQTIELEMKQWDVELGYSWGF